MTAEEALEQGYKWFCLHCNKAYKEKPTEWHDDISCMGASIEMCRCGCDLFMSFEEFIEKRDEYKNKKSEPVDPKDNTIRSRTQILDIKEGNDG